MPRVPHFRFPSTRQLSSVFEPRNGGRWVAALTGTGQGHQTTLTSYIWHSGDGDAVGPD